jgi:hypothetical protein
LAQYGYRIIVALSILGTTALAALVSAHLYLPVSLTWLLFGGAMLAAIPLLYPAPPIVSLVLVVPVFFGSVLAASYVANSMRLASFASQVSAFPPPPQARIASQSQTVGVLLGNGNHCDFLVELVLESDVPLDALRTHYSRLELRPAIPGRYTQGPWLDVRETRSNQRSVRITDGPYSRNVDFRCT